MRSTHHVSLRLGQFSSGLDRLRLLIETSAADARPANTGRSIRVFLSEAQEPMRAARRSLLEMVGRIAVGLLENPLIRGALTAERLGAVKLTASQLAVSVENTECREQLVASRARIVTAADEARKQIQRDLHDGAQQRVVTLAIKLKMLAQSDAACASGLDADLQELIAHADDALTELRNLAHGLHPPALSRGGLQPALTALAKRSSVPVALDLRLAGRPAEPVELAAYYLVAEMLTNAAKHTNASRVDVHMDLVDGALRVRIRDDGAGGADPSRGSGLVGLRDRVEALAGTITINSPQGEGTTLVATLPLGQTPLPRRKRARI